MGDFAKTLSDKSDLINTATEGVKSAISSGLSAGIDDSETDSATGSNGVSGSSFGSRTPQGMPDMHCNRMAVGHISGCY